MLHINFKVISQQSDQPCNNHVNQAVSPGVVNMTGNDIPALKEKKNEKHYSENVKYNMISTNTPSSRHIP